MSVIDPTCPTGCSDFLPVPVFDDCNPEVHFGEIRKVYLAALDASIIADWTTSTDWVARIDNDDVADIDSIRELTVSADMPAGAADVVDISNKRKVTTPSTFTINMDIDETNDENYELMRWSECNTRVRLWFATDDHLYGGETGVIADLMLKEVIERGNKSLHKIMGTATWEAKYSPERCVNPLT